MAGRFIPDSDSDFASMAKQFADQIAKDPDRYTLSDLDSELLTRKVKAFRDALATSKMRSTRTPDAICAKDHRRKEAEEIVRRLGRVIRASDQVSVPDKVRVYIKERSKSTARRKCPVQAPIVTYIGATGEHGHNSYGFRLILARRHSRFFREHGKMHAPREGACGCECASVRRAMLRS